MPQKPKSDGKKPEPDRVPPDPHTKVPEDSTLAEDQKKRGYYYDDAYGYRNFEPEEAPQEEQDTGRTKDK